MFSFRKLLATSLLAACSFAAAAAYPERPIRMIVGFAAGGSGDVNARLTAQALGAALGQPVVVENRPGAAGVIAVQQVARSEPDGYTLLFHSSGTHVITPHLTQMTVDPLTDLVPIVRIAEIGLVLIGNRQQATATFDQMVKAAKAKPGTISYGSPGIGTSHHLAMEMVERQLGLDLVHIGYKGSAPGLQDLVSGQIQYMVDTISTAKPLIDSGRVIPLAVTTAQRSPILPDVPTLRELGVKDANVGIWLGISAPAGTSDEVVQRINQTFNQLLNEPNSPLRAKLAETGWTNGGGTSAEFKRSIEQESAEWGSLIKAAGIKLQ